MNTPQMFELAVRECLAQYASEAVPVSWLHCGLTPTDGDNKSGVERFPQILIIAGGKGRNDDGQSWDTVVTATCVTIAEEDRDGANLVRMYEAVEDFFEHLLEDHEEDEERLHFVNVVRQSLPSFCLGAFEPEAMDGVTLTDGLRIIQFGGTLNYRY